MIKVNDKEILFEQFPNGETKLCTDNFPKNGFIITDVEFKYENDSDLIKLLFVTNYIRKNYRSGNATLHIYYMPYSRMDRSENGSPFTLKYVADFINSLNYKYVNIIEPHSDVTPAIINNSTSVYLNFGLIPMVKNEVNFDDDRDYIVFPDAGASKRYSKMKAKNVLIGNKVRDFETGKIEGLELHGKLDGDGYKAIIVDDLSSYGGTFVHTSKALKKEGFEEIYLLVTHAENSIFKGKLFEHIDKVFTTDSILTEQNHWENKRFESQLKIYNIGEMINDVEA